MGSKGINKLFFLLALIIVAQKSYSFPLEDELIILNEISTEKVDLKVEEEKDIVTPTQITLKKEQGQIYSIVDPIPGLPKLAINANEFQSLSSSTVNLYIYTNYQDVIDRWELLVYDSDDRNRNNPVLVIEGTGEDLKDELQVNYDPNKITPGSEYIYTLKVYDKEGFYDRTAYKIILFNYGLDNLQEYDLKNSVYGRDEVVDRNISISGSKVRVIGKDLKGLKSVNVGDIVVDVNNNGDFLYEIYTKDFGVKDIPIKLVGEDDTIRNYILEAYVPEDYSFGVGIADLYIAQNYVTGNNAILENSVGYDENIFATGRLAFYYKRVWDRYRLTAQADTWERELKYLFRDFTDRRPRDLFEKLERDQIEFNLGDESVYYKDTDSSGKFYIKLERDRSSILWGSYDTGFTGNYYADYNRSIYGFKGEYQSLDGTKYGETKNQFQTFVSRPDTLYASDVFRGTGGSVYFLSFQDIVTGSAKVKIQIRDERTNRILREVVLIEGKDYEINDLQGRIILTNPLPTVIAAGTSGVIKDEPFYGENVNLVVDYEYYTGETDFAKSTYGFRGKSWITDWLALGGTYVSEDRGGAVDKYELESVDLTFRKSERTFLRFEYAHTEGSQNIINNFSYDGGYNSYLDRESYDEIRKNFQTIYNGINGDAYAIEGEVALDDFFKNASSKDNITFWYNRKDKGFSTAGFSTLSEHDDYGITSEFQVNDRFNLEIGANSFEETSEDIYNLGKERNIEEKRANIIGEYQYSEKLELAGEVEYIKDKGTNGDGDEKDEEAVLVGAKVEYDLDPNKTIYTKVQGTAYNKDYEENNMITLGTDIRITDKARLKAEGSTGNRGNGIEILGNYDFTPDHNLYIGYTFDDESNDFFNESGGNESVFTVGQKYKYNDQMSMYHENQFLSDDVGNGFLQSYGLDYKYTDDISMGILIQDGDIDTEDGKLSRTSVSTYSRYYTRDFLMRNKLEYGKDRGLGISADRWATINKGKKVINDEYTLFGEFNFLYRDAKEGSDDRSAEAGLGLAYRPIWNDRLNLILKYEYVYNIGIDAQFLNVFNDTKAHILSLEGIYEITQRLSIGGKYAYRKEEVKIDGSSKWFDSSLDLSAIRLNYEVIKDWYAYGEYHILRDIEEDSYEHGAIIGVYKEIHKHLKVGAGYNFTEFDDDLSDLDYDAKGWFVNIIGKF